MKLDQLISPEIIKEKGGVVSLSLPKGVLFLILNSLEAECEKLSLIFDEMSEKRLTNFFSDSDRADAAIMPFLSLIFLLGEMASKDLITRREAGERIVVWASTLEKIKAVFLKKGDNLFRRKKERKLSGRDFFPQKIFDV